MEEINDMLLTASDEEDIVSETEDHVSEASELSSDDDELHRENDFTNSIYMYKDKSLQYRREPPL